VFLYDDSTTLTEHTVANRHSMKMGRGVEVKVHAFLTSVLHGGEG